MTACTTSWLESSPLTTIEPKSVSTFRVPPGVAENFLSRIFSAASAGRVVDSNRIKLARLIIIAIVMRISPQKSSVETSRGRKRLQISQKLLQTSDHHDDPLSHPPCKT